MATNLSINHELLNEALKVGGVKTNYDYERSKVALPMKVLVDTSVWSLAFSRKFCLAYRR